MDIDQTYCSKSLRDRRILSVEKYVKSNAGKYARIYNIDLEDMMQDAWLSVVMQSMKSDDVSHLVVAARRGVIGSIRKKTSPTENMNYSATSVNEHGDDIDIESEYSEGDFLFRSYLNTISKDYPVDEWQAFYLVEGCGYLYPEAGEIVGMSRDKVKRSREKIMKRICADMGVPFVVTHNGGKIRNDVYRFIHDDGETFSGIQSEFIAKYSLDGGSVTKLIKGTRKQFKGWRLAK